MHRFDYSIPYFVIYVQGIRIVVTRNIVSEVLHVPRVAHPDYPGCECLRIVFKDELMSLFCETPSSWGKHQNTLCSAFAKGPRFLNMVMTFILHPLSHYNTITETYARFLLSLIEDLSIDFPYHFILFLIDVYMDTMTRDKLIFYLLSRVSPLHFHLRHRCSYRSIKRSTASTEVAPNRDGSSSSTATFHPPPLLCLQQVE